MLDLNTISRWSAGSGILSVSGRADLATAAQVTSRRRSKYDTNEDCAAGMEVHRLSVHYTHPKLLGALQGEGVLNLERPLKLLHVLLAVGAGDTLEARRLHA